MRLYRLRVKESYLQPQFHRLRARRLDSRLFVQGNLTPQNQDLGGCCPPVPECESPQRNQIGHQSQNKFGSRNHGFMMPHRFCLREHQLSQLNNCPRRYSLASNQGRFAMSPAPGSFMGPRAAVTKGATPSLFSTRSWRHRVASAILLWIIDPSARSGVCYELLSEPFGQLLDWE